MRVLVATTAGAGHLGPMVPIARALRNAGHEVEVAAPASFAGVVERAGFHHRPFADVPFAELEAVFGGLPGLPVGEARSTVIAEVFGRLNTGAALPGMEAMIAARPPDLVLREPCELSSYLVAQAAGIPHAQVGIGLAAFHGVAADLWEGPLVELGAAPGLSGLRSAPQFSLVPPSFEDPDHPGPVETARFRDGEAGGAAHPLPEWWARPGDPLVHVTFALEGGAAAVGGLAAALEQVLADESYATAAGRVAAEVAALPLAADVVPMLEALAGGWAAGSDMAADTGR